MAEIKRLNYIGSKFQLLEWLTTTIKDKTGIDSFEGKVVADLFAGTGIVSYHFRTLGATVLSNDAELYSSIITRAFTRCAYTDKCAELISQLDATSGIVGLITTHYSPHEKCERKFFTVENALKIDAIRRRLEELKDTITDDEYTFILASLIISADAVSNVPAVYGCFLKNFKAKALKPLCLKPIHTLTEVSESSRTLHSDVLALEPITADVVYLDPPYNGRQYSKNYFPLNIIAKSPVEEVTLKGKTGIPSDCFISPFCQKAGVAKAFHKMISNLNAEWVFVSYNSEGILSHEKMSEILSQYGDVTVVERDYKRFKSFDYNKDKAIQEFMFCLHKSSISK
jgi:adenine-specific DNA-methyltransferase